MHNRTDVFLSKLRSSIYPRFKSSKFYYPLLAIFMLRNFVQILMYTRGKVEAGFFSCFFILLFWKLGWSFPVYNHNLSRKKKYYLIKVKYWRINNGAGIIPRHWWFLWFLAVRFSALTCVIGLGVGLVSYWCLELKRRFFLA